MVANEQVWFYHLKQYIPISQKSGERVSTANMHTRSRASSHPRPALSGLAFLWLKLMSSHPWHLTSPPATNFNFRSYLTIGLLFLVLLLFFIVNICWIFFKLFSMKLTVTLDLDWFLVNSLLFHDMLLYIHLSPPLSRAMPIQTYFCIYPWSIFFLDSRITSYLGPIRLFPQSPI